ncbi:hypothetical protein B8A08_14650, partial [Staphylococcus aureus]
MSRHGDHHHRRGAEGEPADQSNLYEIRKAEFLDHRRQPEIEGIQPEHERKIDEAQTPYARRAQSVPHAMVRHVPLFLREHAGQVITLAPGEP